MMETSFVFQYFFQHWKSSKVTISFDYFAQSQGQVYDPLKIQLIIETEKTNDFEHKGEFGKAFSFTPSFD